MRNEFGKRISIEVVDHLLSTSDTTSQTLGVIYNPKPIHRTPQNVGTIPSLQREFQVTRNWDVK